MEMTILEKIEMATENVPKVYNRGYSNGFKAGSAAGGGSSGGDEASIHAALDDVIAFQTSLLPLIKTFTFDERGTIHTLEFEEGMTWGEWCESKYNTINLTVLAGSVYFNDFAAFALNSENTTFSSDTLIVEGETIRPA